MLKIFPDWQNNETLCIHARVRVHTHTNKRRSSN